MEKFISLLFIAICVIGSVVEAKKTISKTNLLLKTNNKLLRQLLKCLCFKDPVVEEEPCPEPFEFVDGLCLFLDPGSTFMFWDDAQNFCFDQGGRLAEYYSEDEFNTMREFAMEDWSNSGAWMGGYDLTNDGYFVWDSTQQEVPYGYGWGTNQPDLFGYETHLHFSGIIDYYLNNAPNGQWPIMQPGAYALCQAQSNVI